VPTSFCHKTLKMLEINIFTVVYCLQQVYLVI
jgi:hypothetical protein